MKRFLKVCAIMALVMIVAGAALGVIGGGVAGSATISQVVDSVTGGRISADFDSFFSGFGANFEISDSSMFSKDKEVLSGTVEKYCPGEGIQNLKVEVGGCHFETKVSDDDYIYLEAKDAHKFQGYVEGDTLYVKSTASSSVSWFQGKCKVTLYLPEEYFFEEADIEIGAGEMEISRLYANRASLEAGAGQIELKGTVAEELRIDVGAGQIELKDMEVGELSVEVGMGEFVGKGAINGNADVACSMGNVEIKVQGEKKDFNYRLQGAMGNIDLDGDSFGGFGAEKNIDNDAEKTMEIECSMGNITVEFMD